MCLELTAESKHASGPGVCGGLLRGRSHVDEERPVHGLDHVNAEIAVKRARLAGSALEVEQEPRLKFMM